MTIDEAIEVLELHNKWRKGADIEMQEIVYNWRAKSPAIVELWRGLEEAATAVILNPHKKAAYREGFIAGKNYIKDSVNLTLSNDALAASFQTLRQYRKNLIKWLEKL